MMMSSCIDVRAHVTHMYSKHVSLSPGLGRFTKADVSICLVPRE